MRKYILFLLVGSLSLPAIGQKNIKEVLVEVETNNLQLKANKELFNAQRWDAKSSNNLSNPSVSYSKVWDSRDSKETDAELTVSQGFDFPSVYFSRRRANNYQLKGAEAFFNFQRQEILFQAQEICLDIIKLNQEREYVEERMKYAQQLLETYNRMLHTGNATKMDLNKIKLDVLNQKTEYTIIQSELKKKEADLKAINGNIEIDVNNLTEYTEAITLPDYSLLTSEIVNSSFEIEQTQHEYNSALKQVAVNKAGWLPGFEVGYKRTAGPNRHSNGFVFGVSIPLFNNRGKVSSSKAVAISKLYEQDIVKNKVQSDVYQAYQEAKALIEQIKDYDGLINVDENLTILKKALEGGELSVTEYFVEIGIMYQSAQNYINLNNMCHKQLSRLYKHRL